MAFYSMNNSDEQNMEFYRIHLSCTVILGISLSFITLLFTCLGGDNKFLLFANLDLKLWINFSSYQFCIKIWIPTDTLPDFVKHTASLILCKSRHYFAILTKPLSPHSDWALVLAGISVPDACSRRPERTSSASPCSASACSSSNICKCNYYRFSFFSLISISSYYICKLQNNTERQRSVQSKTIHIYFQLKKHQVPYIMTMVSMM